MLKEIKNFTLAAVNHAINGFQSVSDEVYYDRLSICETCEHKKPGWICGECGCALLVKARWAEQKCPLKEPKWDEKQELKSSVSTCDCSRT